MRLNPAAFDRHLENIGQQVLWRRSYSCPCVSPTSGQPDAKHALCAGKGRIWDAPIRTVTGIASQKIQAMWAQMGLWEAGDMVVSIPQSSPLWDAGKFDRVVAVNSTDVFSVPLVRGHVSERLLYPVANVSRCFWLDPVSRTIVEGAVPVIGEDGRPTWAGSGQPPDGYTYSLTGEKNPEYFVWGDLPSNRNEHSGARLPKRVILRTFDLFSR